ncbi:MAG TPA: thiol:disulfide interchange protein DsbA/DsbL [Steroidobacteraceae bacterium]|nr:thiol:disulfide interchange protein DsbA/DsbL [Steroidobacteraceae bacterium]
MFKHLVGSLVASLALVAGFGTTAQAAGWEAGKHYDILPQAQRTNVAPGKVEVMEVFSYGCPACDHFQPIMKRIKASLPPNAQLVYLPASWNAGENWPTFQRAYLTAKSLGVSEKAHDQMFDAIWNTGELGILEGTTTGALKKKLPSIEDIARFYQKTTGAKAADFVAASKSFSVDLKMRQADAQIIAMKVTGTPTLVVNGKYRLNNNNLTTPDDFIGVVKFLVEKESAAAKPASAPAPAATPSPQPAKKS